MAKVSKSLYLNEDLVKLVSAFEERTGANFTRTMTAALLQFLFATHREPEEAKAFGPDPEWVRLAVLLERGALTVPQLPGALVTTAAESSEMLLKSHRQDDEPSQYMLDHLQRELRIRTEAKRKWASRVQRCGGDMDACVDTLRNP